MRIYINDLEREITDNSTLTQALEELNISTKGIAIASKEEIIARSIWDNYTLSPNEKVTIIRATCGG
ncbi:MAG: sulfur carrier protein ThiS [Bacteroidales bacterium]